MTIEEMKASNERYRQRNPWTACNWQNQQALCGRFPTQEKAEEYANQRGGVREVCQISRVVYFSEMPLL